MPVELSQHRDQPQEGWQSHDSNSGFRARVKTPKRWRMHDQSRNTRQGRFTFFFFLGIQSNRKIYKTRVAELL